RWVVLTERAMHRIKAVHMQLIDAEIGDDGEAIVSGGLDPVGVRSGLSLVVHAGTDELDEGGGVAQAAVLEDGKHGRAAARIVCEQDVLASFVEGDITGIGAAGSNFVQ